MPLYLVQLSMTVPVVAPGAGSAVDLALAEKCRIVSDREIDSAQVIKRVTEPQDLASEWLDNPPYGQTAGAERTCRQILVALARAPQPQRYCILLTCRDRKGRSVIEVLGNDTNPKEDLDSATKLFDSPEEAWAYIRSLSHSGKTQTVAPYDGPWNVPLPGTIPLLGAPPACRRLT